MFFNVLVPIVAFRGKGDLLVELNSICVLHSGHIKSHAMPVMISPTKIFI
jgi:hypothetical protein